MPHKPLRLSLPNKLALSEKTRVSRTLIATGHVMLALNTFPIFLGIYPMFGVIACMVLIFIEHTRADALSKEALLLLQKRIIIAVLGLIGCTMYVTGLTEELAETRAWLLLVFTFTPLHLYDAYTTMQGRRGLSFTHDVLALVKRALKQ